MALAGDGFWKGRSVVVTGATGFLGSHLTAMLVDFGADVCAIVRDDVPRTAIAMSWRGLVSEVRGDVRDIPLVSRVLGEYDAEVLFHLAAQTQVGVANRNPIATFEANIQGTWAVLEAARTTPSISAVVVASSDKAYGEQPALPYDEDMALLGRHPYDVSKACADMLSTSYRHSFGLPVCITRCGNLFGPGDMNWQRLVPGTIRSLLHGEAPVIRSDGTMTRDYIHVEDASNAYIRVAENLSKDRSMAGTAMNFSTESPVSVLEMVGIITRAVGVEIAPRILATATNEIPNQYLSAQRARSTLGWVPRYGLEDGVDNTVRWYRDYFEVRK